jgi:hypothetical protein
MAAAARYLCIAFTLMVILPDEPQKICMYVSQIHIFKFYKRMYCYIINTSKVMVRKFICKSFSIVGICRFIE